MRVVQLTLKISNSQGTRKKVQDIEEDVKYKENQLTFTKSTLFSILQKNQE